MADNQETIKVIKDSIFEIVISGTGDVKFAANYLHHVDKFSKEDILQAIKEMQAEMEED
ncbi:hypothetical protein BCP78_0073 [Bacillus phage BCP78]|uniref:Uncharacterized protein n=3 Tax=Tsarbombavirus BCP78 TaxID=1985182 RepID=J9PRK9_9CAUD|nr:hypothetical protein BCP78_0073 [Bacillus phage BCP78]YP_009783436.1 hypothetical protein QLX27_gp063 [Bacillus phage BCU4]AEW47080.1 hypothetical protein BCP78_0073 [Bacillus phage BCP78]AEW47569.1 hypothetical protein BCU4_0063 [Bacillus phage BCU4]AQN32447.1 hypothetical protein BCP12_024 [Bacillus phage BCP12]